MRERCGVEVKAHLALFGPLHPALEVLGLYLVAVDNLVAELTIGLV